MGLTCPTPAEKAAARAAIVAGDITYHAFPHNAELENTNEAMLREGLRLSHALDEVSGYARGWCVFVCVWMIELCAVMCARCISTCNGARLECVPTTVHEASFRTCFTLLYALALSDSEDRA
jgi:hypothetical protein